MNPFLAHQAALSRRQFFDQATLQQPLHAEQKDHADAQREQQEQGHESALNAVVPAFHWRTPANR